MLDKLAGWELGPQAVDADAGYGTTAAFREALTACDRPYVCQVTGDLTAHSADAVPELIGYSGLRSERRVAGHLRDRGPDRGDGVVLGGDDHPRAGPRQQRGVVGLVSPARQGDLGHAVHEAAGHRARTAVGDQQVGPLKQGCLWDELCDHGVGRHWAELVGVEPAPGRGDHDAAASLPRQSDGACLGGAGRR